MAARDEYPTMANGGFDDSEIGAMFDEIDRLRRWKSEAIEVLGAWEKVWDAAGRPGRPGQSKAEATRQWVEHRAD